MLCFGSNLTLLKQEDHDLIEATKDWKDQKVCNQFWSLFKNDRSRFYEIYDKFRFIGNNKFLTNETKCKFWEMYSKIEHVEFKDSWMWALQLEFEKPYFKQLCTFIDQEIQGRVISPNTDQIFSWMTFGYIWDVKVVILSLFPYPSPNSTNGLCFSIPRNRRGRKPKSLEALFEELRSDLGIHPQHGDLSGWAEQGVLLLNTILTRHQRSLHSDRGWEAFTTSVITWLNDNLNGVVFLLWGEMARKNRQIIDLDRHHVLTADQPSETLAYEDLTQCVHYSKQRLTSNGSFQLVEEHPPRKCKGFYGCKHFSRTNQILIGEGKTPIDWNVRY